MSFSNSFHPTLPKFNDSNADALLLVTAEKIGETAVAIVKAAPKDEQAAVGFYVEQLREVFEGNYSGDECTSKVAAFIVLCLYQFCPWGDNDHDSFQEWIEAVGFDHNKASFVWSFVREFEQWEPADAETFAAVIILDRAIIRGARVAASALEETAFLAWLERNYTTLPGGYEIFQAAKACVRNSSGVFADRGSREELERIARNVLREVGRMYGRTGLNSVRRQIGAPPSARRPSHLALGALYSANVYKVAENYLALSASEREAFKCVLHKLDTGDNLTHVWEKRPDQNLGFSPSLLKKPE